MNTDRNLVLTYVLTEANNDDLESIFEAIKIRRAMLSTQAKHSVKRGDKVKFTSKGTIYKGVVMSVKVKNAVVKCETPSNTTYRVPLNMLKAA